jgi:hypothetical protein
MCEPSLTHPPSARPGERPADHPPSGDAVPTAASTFGFDQFLEVFQNTRRLHAAGLPALLHSRKSATNGIALPGRRAYGLEIEFILKHLVSREDILPAINTLAKELLHRGLGRQETVGNYHEALYRGYTTELDGGILELDDNPLCEWVSPISFDRIVNWDVLSKVLAVIRQHDGEDSPLAGSHVHVSVGDFEGQAQLFVNVLTLAAEYEDILYRLGSSQSHDEPLVWRRVGDHERMLGPWLQQDPDARIRSLDYRRPNPPEQSEQTTLQAIREKQGLRDPASDSERQEMEGREVAVNMESVNGKPGDHLEFRIPDGSLKADFLQAQVVLYLHLVEKAKKMPAQSGDRRAEPLGTHFDIQGEPTPDELDAFKRDTESFRHMLDDLFERDSDKARMTALFALTRWQPGEDFKHPLEQYGEVGLAILLALVSTAALARPLASPPDAATSTQRHAQETDASPSRADRGDA